jgi:deaminated glutathione amidase
MTLKLAILQTNTGIDPVQEAGRLAAQIGEATAQGAAIIFTPEMSGLLDRDRARAGGNIHHEADDPVLAAVCAAAARHNVWVHLGSLALRGSGDKFVNRGFLIRPDGTIVARYAKIHLFDVALGTESWRESAAYDAGEEAVVAATPWGTLGLTICYDVRFPALHRALAQAGAQMIAVPAAFTRPTGQAHWHVLLRARAIETGCWVIAAAQTGEHADGRATYGHSLVVSPWGEVVLDMGEAPGIGIATIDLAAVATARGKVPALEHARPFRVVGP